jgi:16S rRNA (guanine966-N2)-methyltransferase
MRVIGGIYGGRKLLHFEAEHIRPTTDYIKEALFNTLSPYLHEEMIVLDAFSGTGSLGIEALSRGVKHVTFVDQHPKSIHITKQNLKLLDIPAEFYSVITADSLTYLRGDLQNFDLILLDPPFTKKLAHKIMSILSENESIKNQCLISIEYAKHEPFAESYNRLELFKEKTKNDKVLKIFVRSAT